MKVNLRVKSNKGFTLIELMIVIAIIGILAAIAVPQFSAYRTKGYNTSARADVKNAFTSAQSFFSDSPTASVDLATLSNYGFRSSSNVNATASGDMNSLNIGARHGSGDTTYRTDSSGTISP